MATNICTAEQASVMTAWCSSRWKRAMDVVVAAVSLVILSPLMIVISVAIAVGDGAPILFRQRRLGRGGQAFQLIKFRTMTVAGGSTSCGLTRGGDSRITPVGRWLRMWKIDELPQLFNVLIGEMSLVGPRPDLEQFWLKATPEDRQVLLLTPGLTGSASVAFRDEERTLADVPPEHLTSFYLECLLPQKARLDREYAMRATFWGDCSIIFETAFGSVALFRRVKKRHHA